MGISIAIGMILGLIAGYFGGLIDMVVMRFVDIMLCFPSFFLILAVIAFLNPSIFNVMAIIGLTGWMGVTRLVRAEVLSVKTRDYIVSAKVQGLPSWLILSKHILPNVFYTYIRDCNIRCSRCYPDRIITQFSWAWGSASDSVMG